PPQASSKPNGLWMLLPIFGGAIGGALYAGVLMAHASTDPRKSRGAAAEDGGGGGANAIKLVVGLFLVLAGGLFLVIGGVQGWGTWTVTRRQPKLATAAE